MLFLGLAVELITVFDGVIEYHGQWRERKRSGDDRVSAAFTQDDCTSTITGCHKIAGG